MTGFSSRVEQVSISGIREVFEAAGEDAINLGLGQPDFPTPDHAREAAVEAIQSGATDAYTSNKGTIELREAIAERTEADMGHSVDPNDVIATAGGSEALHVAIEAHVDAGQEVLIPDPGFVSYEALTHLAGGTPVPVDLREDLTMDPADVEAAITEDTAMFVVCSPANPTGAVQSEADMREFARIADEHDVVCISDEVYGRIVFDGEHHSPMKFAETDNVLVVDACSKTYSMTRRPRSSRPRRRSRVHRTWSARWSRRSPSVGTCCSTASTTWGWRRPRRRARSTRCPACPTGGLTRSSTAASWWFRATPSARTAPATPASPTPSTWRR
jgi:aspartate aminotransferase